MQPSDQSITETIRQAKKLAGFRRFGDAAKILREAVKLSPNNLTLLNMLAPICLKVGHASEAINLYTRSLALCADDPVTHTGLANALITAHRLDNAVSQIGYIKRSFPLNEHIYSVEVRMRLHQNNIKQAFSVATQGLREYPNHPTLLELRASAAIKLGMFRHAHADIENGICIYPDDPYMNCTKADLLVAEGRTDEAICHLTAYLNRVSNSTTTTAKLGHIYLNCGDNKAFESMLDQTTDRVRRMPAFGSMAAKGFWLTGQDMRAADIAARILDINVTEMATIVYLASTPAKLQNLRLLEKICHTYPQDELKILDLRARRAKEDRSTLRQIGHNFLVFNHPRGIEAEEIDRQLFSSRPDARAKVMPLAVEPSA